MKKTVLSLFILVALVGCVEKKEETSSSTLPKTTSATQVFDNSIPGFWEMTMKFEYANHADANQEKTAQKCISQQEIDETTKHSLENKFNTQGLKCVSQMKKFNETTGEFSLSCSGYNPIKKSPVEMKVKGNILSEPKKSEMKVNYTIKSGDNTPVEIIMTTQAKYIGTCAEQPNAAASAPLKEKK